MEIKILTSDEVKARIPLIVGTAKALESDLHQILVSCLDHVRAHGDHRGLTMLLNALPKGQRVQAMVAWVREFSSGKLSLALKDGVWGAQLRGEAEHRDTDFRVADAAEITYADFTKEVEPKAFTMAKLFAMVERIANDTTTLPNGARRVSEDVAAAAATMIRSVRAQPAAATVAKAA